MALLYGSNSILAAQVARAVCGETLRIADWIGFAITECLLFKNAYLPINWIPNSCTFSLDVLPPWEKLTFRAFALLICPAAPLFWTQIMALFVVIVTPTRGGCQLVLGCQLLRNTTLKSVPYCNHVYCPDKALIARHTSLSEV